MRTDATPSRSRDQRRIEATTEPPAEAEIASLLDRFAAGVGLHSVRDLAVLRWRFADGPFFNGRVVYLRRDGRLVGYYATTATEFSGAKFLALMEEKLGRKLVRVPSAAFKPRPAYDRAAHIGVHVQKQAGRNVLSSMGVSF